MAIREVVRLGDPLLRTTCEEVADPVSTETAETIADLRDTLAHWRETTGYGRAIAAPQIGVLRRIVFLNVDRETPWPFINPRIVERSAETMTVWDGCLSFLSVFCQVERHRWITVRYQDAAGEWREVRAEGDLSELLQHEIDHLDGILTVDRMTDVKTLVTREEFEKRYRDGSPYGR
ncbi:MAG: peptide deformylase [Gemmatimonadetes bacterium]|nr:peptide deformylase [Gemmatimonadota bacterium]